MKKSLREMDDMVDYAEAMADAWREDQLIQEMLEKGL